MNHDVVCCNRSPLRVRKVGKDEVEITLGL